MSAPAPEEHPTGDYVVGHAYAIDEVLPLGRLALHFYGEDSDGRCHWLNFRMLESVQIDGEGPSYPTEEYRGSGGPVTRDIRAAAHFASGYIKWDGCCEVAMDHHMCGISDARLVADALLHVFAYAARQHGFEDCE